jgi:hypothetical protein
VPRGALADRVFSNTMMRRIDALLALAEMRLLIVDDAHRLS